MNVVNTEADSWAEVLDRLRRAQGQLAAVIATSGPCHHSPRPGSSGFPDVPDVPSAAPASAAAEAFAFFADARVRPYVPVLALKHAARHLSDRFNTRGDKSGET
ncbi:hypothetical protein [Streptomyces sp. NBC_01235]|uniref:hypothetical protein n=1 Tax=Streptomyces sp. NBC_01235 TaxID=2903788 RepID=UPI002E107F64|nr:hypothetical protein OG289_04470 [Streptomyces sp. NBC_01235]